MNTEIISVKEFAVWAASQLSKADLYYGHGSQGVKDEGFWLASFIAKFEYPDFEDGWQNKLTRAQMEKGCQLLSKRVETKKPLAYLINQIWFAGHRFYIDERALVPRSHLGEWIPDQFEPWIDVGQVKSVLDLCCGGGSIGISCALYFDEVNVDLADLSEPALQVAQRNIEDYQFTERVNTIHSDLFERIEHDYDLILCNPPYVSETNMKKLPQEYRYEPDLALVSGVKGLDSISIILAQADQYLSDTGTLILEAGTAAPALEQALNLVPLNWMMSASGESVVLIISKQELLEYKDEIQSLVN